MNTQPLNTQSLRKAYRNQHLDEMGALYSAFKANPSVWSYLSHLGGMFGDWWDEGRIPIDITVDEARTITLLQFHARAPMNTQLSA